MQIRKTRELARSAFTLTEMVVVVAIIVILAGIGGGFAWKVYDDSRESAAQLKAVNIQKAAEDWRRKNGDEMPTIQNLTTPEEQGGRAYLTDEDIKDPWGQLYQLEPGKNGQIRVFTLHGGKKIASHKE